MSGPEPELVADRGTAARRIAAPAHAIFLLVSHPARHVDIDGSGMLQAAPGATPLTAVGQTFDMDMDRRPLGDIPTMAEYQVRCTVTQLIPDRLIEWTVRAAGKPPAGHLYGWQIEPLTDGECLVTLYCDWTNISDELRARSAGPSCRPTGCSARSTTSIASPRGPSRRGAGARPRHGNINGWRQRSAARRTGKIERVKALLTGIGSPGRAQIDLFGTSYPTGLPTITSKRWSS